MLKSQKSKAHPESKPAKKSASKNNLPSKLTGKVSSTKNTAGTLLYRKKDDKLEVLLVHPAGNYNRKAPWSIPKGQPEKLETFEDTARRETIEETGVTPAALKPLGYIDYTKSRKRVHCFYGQAPQGAQPKNVSWEVDKVEFMPLEKAMKAIHHDQLQLLQRLQFVLSPR